MASAARRRDMDMMKLYVLPPPQFVLWPLCSHDATSPLLCPATLLSSAHYPPFYSQLVQHDE